MPGLKIHIGNVLACVKTASSATDLVKQYVFGNFPTNSFSIRSNVLSPKTSLICNNFSLVMPKYSV